MKTLILLLTLTLSLMADFNYGNIVGQWEFSSLRDSSVSFGRFSSRDGLLVVEFDRRGTAVIKTTGERYYYVIENGNLVISEYPPSRKGGFNGPVDIISMNGSRNGCSTVVYNKKGIAGVSSRNSFQACQMRPEPVYTRPYDYNDGYEYRR